MKNIFLKFIILWLMISLINSILFSFFQDNFLFKNIVIDLFSYSLSLSFLPIVILYILFKRNINYWIAGYRFYFFSGVICLLLFILLWIILNSSVRIWENIVFFKGFLSYFLGTLLSVFIWKYIFFPRKSSNE